MRSGALEVLSVRHHMFSSDPRMMVGKEVLREDGGEVWSLKIARVRRSDQGLYLCQVCKRSYTFVLNQIINIDIMQNLKS